MFVFVFLPAVIAIADIVGCCQHVSLSVCMSQQATKWFCTVVTSCSVDHHVSGCEYLTGICTFVCSAESAKSRKHDSVVTVGDVDMA